MARQIVLIVARASNGVIGRDGAMPWHLPADLRRFKALTVGKPVVMGRKTFESIGKPLPGRHNIVLTRSRHWSATGVTIVPNLAEALAATGMDPRTHGEIMVIGGAELYAQALPIATRIELTEVHSAPHGDTFFPPLDPESWHEIACEAHAADGEQPAFTYRTLARR